MSITLGSLFDGIGGFPLAAQRVGITPVWASEIEPFPLRVTALRFPDMAQLGDITQLKGTDVHPVDIVTGGSPCQDLSIAGARAGLAGERSGLFLEQIRLIREMREEDQHRERPTKFVRPRFMVWENVPGAFSSAGGGDFRIVLEETLRIAAPACTVPRPPGGTWHPAGAVVGDGFSLAWRTLDAQYWGVPQRRARIFLVADFGGTSAPQVLFEPTGLPGHPPAGGETGQAPASQAGVGAEGAGRNPTAFYLNQRNEVIDAGKVSGTLLASQNVNMQTFVASFSAGAGEKAGGISYSESIAPTLKASSSGNMAPSVLCLSDQGGQVMDWSENVSATLRSQEHGHQPAVLLFDNHRQDCRYDGPLDVAPTMQGSYGTGGNNTPLAMEGRTYQNCVGALTSSDSRGVNSQYVNSDKLILESPNLVRRLTPLECERLQGFPDGWTDLPGASDSARYRALGNSVAIPCVEFVLGRIKTALEGGVL